MMSRKGQVSVELLVIVGFIVLVMVPVLFSIYMRGNDYKERISVSQVNIAAGRLAQAVDSVGYLGGNAKLVLEVQMPQGVEVKAGSREIVFRFDDNGLRNDIVKGTKFPITTFGLEKLQKTGTYFVEVRAQEGNVEVTVD